MHIEHSRIVSHFVVGAQFFVAEVFLIAHVQLAVDQCFFLTLSTVIQGVDHGMPAEDVQFAAEYIQRHLMSQSVGIFHKNITSDPSVALPFSQRRQALGQSKNAVHRILAPVTSRPSTFHGARTDVASLLE
jgi:hypothetical protein